MRWHQVKLTGPLEYLPPAHCCWIIQGHYVRNSTIDTPTITSFIKQASELLPGHAANLKKDFERNLRPIIESKLAELNLVTRDDFEQQLRLLERLESKVTQLEAQLASFEKPQSD